MNLIVFHLKYTLEILFLLSPGKVRQILPETFMNCIFCSSLLTISIFTIPWTPDAAQPDLRPALILLEVSFLLTKVVWTGNGGAPFIITALQYYDKRLPRDAGDALPASDACLFVLAHPPGGTACVSSALKSDSFQCVCRCHFAPDAV